MNAAKRTLDAGTPRRVVAALLVGAFTEEILSFVGWLARTGEALLAAPALRGVLLAALNLALQAGFIFLVLRGLRSVLERRPGSQASLAGKGPRGDGDAKVPPAERVAESLDPTDGLQEGRRNGHDHERS